MSNPKKSVSEGRKPKIPVQELTVGLYESVIDDTVSRVKPEFVQEGIDETVLEELRALWEQNIVKSGVLGASRSSDKPQSTNKEPTVEPPPRQSATTTTALPTMQPAMVASGNVPFQIAGPAVPIAGHPGAPMPAAFLYSAHAMRFGMQFPGMGPPMRPGQVFSHYVAHPQATTQQQLTAVTLPQQRVPSESAPMVGQKRSLDVANSGRTASTAKQPQLGVPANSIPQLDGPADDEQGAADAKETRGSVESVGVLNEEDPGAGGSDDLNEDDDLADVDDHEEIDEDSIRNVMLGQFEKVHRSKAKWRINLKNTVATVNGRDYLFKKVTGEMNFS